MDLRSGDTILKLGAILTDSDQTKWCVGPFLGSGGNGEVYTANNSNGAKRAKNYQYVIKIVSTGHLHRIVRFMKVKAFFQESFQCSYLKEEIAFYKLHATLDEITDYKNHNNLTTFGLPHYIANGTHKVDGKTYNFLVIPRYGKDINSFLKEEGHALPEHTIYRLAISMLDVYKYIHNKGKIHGDLKGDNILQGYGPKNQNKVYLVDFGTVSSVSKNFEPNSKRAPHGTLNYSSRDGLLGIETFRGDLEILAYNLIHWSGITLPWVTGQPCRNLYELMSFKALLFMENVENHLKSLFNGKLPKPILQYFNYVKLLKIDEKPDHGKCKSIFIKGLEELGKKNSGKFNLISKPAFSSPKFKMATRKRAHQSIFDYESSGEEDDEFRSKIAKLIEPLEVVSEEFTQRPKKRSYRSDDSDNPEGTSSRKVPRILRDAKNDDSSDKENILPGSSKNQGVLLPKTIEHSKCEG